MSLRTALLVMAIGGCSSTRTGPPAAPHNTPTEPTVPSPTSSAGATTIGTAHPLVVELAARDGSWIAICQARTDTDGDGEIAVNVGMHGDTWGDALRPYVVLGGAGEGEAVDVLVDWSLDDRWLAVVRGGKLALLDGARGTWTELAGADVRDDGVPLGPHRAASVAASRMTYFRGDDTIVIRELPGGAEREVKVAGAKLWRVELHPAGDWARVYAMRKDTDGDGVVSWPSMRTSLSARGCRGPITSYSTGGWSGDTPDELWLDLATGATQTAAPTLSPSPPPPEELGTHDGRPVLAIDRAGRKLVGPDDREGIASGPLRWVAP